MHVTNTTKGPLALNDTTLLLPGIPTPVHNWGQLKKNAVVAAWLKAGVLRESEAAPSPDSSKLLPADKEALVAELTALGVKFHPNTGVTKLQALLDDAKAKAAEAAAAEAAAKGVESTDGAGSDGEGQGLPPAADGEGEAEN